MNKDKKNKTGGLAGIIAADSSICLCGAEDESLLYRGYAIEDLAKHSCFEEVAFLLTRGYLPNEKQLKDYRNFLKEASLLPEKLKGILKLIPENAHVMHVLSAGTLCFGTLSSCHEDLEAIDRLIASLGSILLYWLKFSKTKKEPALESPEDSFAGRLLHLMTGKTPSPEHKKALDVSLILYAEHEFNASTFTVRTITSTRSDYYSSISGGIGALKGPLHGGANEYAMDLIESFKNPEQAKAGVLKMLEDKKLIMGFGHRVYTTSDPRSAIIKEQALALSKGAEDGFLFEIAEAIEAVMKEEKNLFPNLDFYSALAYRFSLIPTPLFTPLFALSRISGWSAHFLEQKQNNKLIRPLSNYIGPKKRPWIPLKDR